MSALDGLLRFTASPRFLDAVVALILAELAALLAWRALRGRGMPSAEAISFLGAGLALVVALRVRGSGGSAAAFGAAMTVALGCHVWHVVQRWGKERE